MNRYDKLPVTLQEFKQYYHNRYYETPKLTYKLDPEVKHNWLNELRSGKHEQGKAQLAHLTTEGNLLECCLGVLCAAQGLESVITPGGIYTYHHNDTEGTAVLPYSFAKAIGMDNTGAFWYSFTVEDTTFYLIETLVDLNDNGFSFSQIADIIEYFF